jgi:PAS domain S-box-containing protein
VSDIHVRPAETSHLNPQRPDSRPQFLSHVPEPGAAYYKALVEKAFDGINVVNARGEIVYCAPNVERLLGYAASEFLGVNALDLVHPEESGHINALFAELVRSAGMSITAEFRFRRKDGTWLWIECTGTNLLHDSCVGGIVCNYRDISERKNYEKMLQHTQEWLRQSLNAARMVAWEWDMSTNYVNCSPNARAYGIESGPVEDFIALVHPDDRQHVLDAVSRAQAGRGEYSTEFRVVLPNGKERWARDQGTILYRDGQPVRMLGVCSDITERRRVEQRLVASESRFRKLADANIIGVTVGDVNGNVTYANDAYLNLIGYSREDLESKSIDWRMITAAEYSALDEKALRDARENGACTPYEKEFVRKNGTRVPVLIGFGLLEGTSSEFIAAVVDLSKQKRLESELRLWAERLKDEAQRKDEFLAMLSHELRNPLAPIRNGLQIIQMPQATAVQAGKAKEMMTRQIGHLTSLVDDLLDVSRISRGRILIRKERVNLVAVIRTAVEDHRGDIEARGINLQFEAPGISAWMQGDQTRLAQVMGNLLTNAAKFTRATGQITVAVSVDPAGHASVFVRDTGIGIESAILERLFQPFGQAPQSIDRSSGGLGLGLALVKGLIELHGGTVQATSEGIGKGAEFSFRVPVEKIFTGEQPAQKSESPRTPSSILIIEDNQDAAESMQLMLELSGHTVSVAYSGGAGIAMAQEHRPQIVLCDIGLPDIDGYQVARNIRGCLPETILIAISGYGQKADKTQALNSGFDRHLTKPVDPAVLEQALVRAESERIP